MSVMPAIAHRPGVRPDDAGHQHAERQHRHREEHAARGAGCGAGRRSEPRTMRAFGSSSATIAYPATACAKEHEPPAEGAAEQPREPGEKRQRHEHPERPVRPRGPHAARYRDRGARPRASCATPATTRVPIARIRASSARAKRSGVRPHPGGFRGLTPHVEGARSRAGVSRGGRQRAVLARRSATSRAFSASHSSRRSRALVRSRPVSRLDAAQAVAHRVAVDAEALRRRRPRGRSPR